MNPRLALLRSLLTPAQLAQLEKVKTALDGDPTCLDRQEHGNAKCIQGIPGVASSSAEGARIED